MCSVGSNKESCASEDNRSPCSSKRSKNHKHNGRINKEILRDRSVVREDSTAASGQGREDSTAASGQGEQSVNNAGRDRDSWDSLETLSRVDITCRLKPEVTS